jgi:rsbT co-antagonist protein RsbR
MVGTERFLLAIEQAGRESMEAEWEHIILPQPTIEDGFRFIGTATGTVGLGMWELMHLDREQKTARFRAKNDWESMYQKALGVQWGSGTLAGKFGGYGTKMFGTYCRAEQVAFTTKGDEYDEFVVRPATTSLDDELEEMLGSEQATKEDLKHALTRLRDEVEERRKVEEDLRTQIDVVRRQEKAIRAMATPILRLWSGILTMPVVGLVDSQRAALMMEDLLEQITRTQARCTILDLTGVDLLDTNAASHLLSIVRAAKLLGSRCLVSGISPSMASTIVSLGLELDEIQTFASLESALRYAIRETRKETHR